MPRLTRSNVSLATLIVFLQDRVASQIIVSTYAGNGTAGATDGPSASSTFNIAVGVAVDSSGNVYVSDRTNQKIRRVSTSGIVSTIAGSGAAGSADGNGTIATFWNPNGIVVDTLGNIYVGDSQNNKIRRITPTGIVSTFAGSAGQGYADGPIASAKFNGPGWLAIDLSNNMYVFDGGNVMVRKITPDGTVSTLAGNGSSGFADGPGSNAMFNNPYSIAVDSSGNVFVADCGNHRIRRITPSGVVSTYVGTGVAGYLDGDASSAQLNSPTGVAVDSRGNVYFSEWNNHRIRVIMTNGTVSTIAGTGIDGMNDGPGESASFHLPYSITLDPSGKLYVAERDGNKIRMVSGLNGLFPTSTVSVDFSTTSADTSTPTASPDGQIYTAGPTKSGGITTATVFAIAIPIVVLVVAASFGVIYMQYHHLSFSLIWQRGWPKLVLIDKRQWGNSPTTDRLIK